MSKRKSLKVAIIIDPMGSVQGSDREEIAKHKQCFGKMLHPVTLNTYRAWSAYPGSIEEHTDLVLFDFGGMGLGTDLGQKNSMHLVQWAQDHPSSLVIVVSSFTYDVFIKSELRELGLKDLHNVVSFFDKLEDPIPRWFRETLDMSGSGTPAKDTLPNIKFFQPTEPFLDWIVTNFRERKIYDVGAGVGHVSSELRLAGCKNVVPVDMILREVPEASILIEDGRTLEYEPGSVVMLARPCHGGFSHAVIKQAKRCACDVIYVGLLKNVHIDLPASGFSLVLEGAGEEGECVYHSPLTVKPPSRMRKSR